MFKEFTKGFRNKGISGLLVFTMIFGVMGSVYMPVTVKAATNYYVATNGSDTNNDGKSLASPFKTIQKAASVAVAGDTVYIRNGTYRETVSPTNSGTSGSKIIYTNYNNEEVIISGADTINGWIQESTNIYYAPMSWNLNDKNQVFVNGTMHYNARWPNNTGSLMNCTLETVDSSADKNHFVDTALTGPDNYWNGANLFILSGSAWIGMTASVTGFVSSTKTLAFGNLKSAGSSYDPKAGNKYYLFGLKSMLDTNNEWWYDSTNSRLYKYSSSGTPTGVEAKKRMTAFDLSGKSHIQIIGLKCFGANIVTNESSNNCSIKKCTIKYISHSDKNTSANEQKNLGIILDGTNNEIRDSELVFSSCSLATVKGIGNQIINNLIDYGGYLPDWDGVVNLVGVDSLISHNTISNGGRDVVKFNAGIRNNEIQYNNIFNGLWLTTDGGMLRGGNCDGQNTKIHHNKIYDVQSSILGYGIYLDNYTHNMIIYNNVLWNCSGLKLNTPSNYNIVYNNTAWDVTNQVTGWGSETMGTSFVTDYQGTRIYNNIVTGLDTGSANIAANAASGKNLTSNPMFVDAPNRNYQLQSSSAAVNAGVAEAGITDGYIGNAPDCGGYESGGTNWASGHNLVSPPNPVRTNANVSHMNRVANGGFERGDYTSWTRTGAQQATIINDNHWSQGESSGYSRSQLYGLRLGGTSAVDSIEQTITGLIPNTTYRVSGWLRSPDGETAVLTVKDFGGSTTSQSSTSSTWTKKAISFTTGNGVTSAVISFGKTSLGTNYIYCDDAGLQQIDDEIPFLTHTEDFEDGIADGWLPLSGTWNVVTDGSAKAYYNSTATSPNRAVVGKADWSDIDMTAIFKVDQWNTGTTVRAGLMGRYVDSSNFYYMFYDKSSQTFKIMKLQGGAQSTLATSAVIPLPPVGIYHTCRFVLKGNSIKAYYNGNVVASATDSSFTEGQAGLYTYNQSVYYDNITINNLKFEENFQSINLDHWITSSGGWEGISDGMSRAYLSNTATGSCRTTTGLSTWQDYSIAGKIKVDSWNTANPTRTGLIGRYLNSSNFYYMFYDKGSQTVKIMKLQGGTQSTLATSAVISPPVAGVYHTYQFELNGTTLKAYLNDVEVATASDSSFSSGTAGLYTYNQRAYYSDIVVDINALTQ